MAMDVRSWLRERLRLDPPSSVQWVSTESVDGDGFVRQKILYEAKEGDPIPAYLFLPTGEAVVGGVVAFHQHNGEFHFGKSEVAGLVGDPFQAFAPALASRGLAVLAPDAITFEDRRASVEGIVEDEGDWLQHYNAMAYRLVNGDLLMRKCLDDAQRALSVLASHPRLDEERVGAMGHSYGGTTTLYLSAVDARCRFGVVSGAVCSFARRQRDGTGINMFELVPGLAETIETYDLLRAISPAPLFVVSATADKYSADADEVVRRAGTDVTHLRVDGEHALEQVRVDAILRWVVERVSSSPH